jgi:hypothetical protein
MLRLADAVADPDVRLYVTTLVAVAINLDWD